jgi:hypothetical protein
MTLRDLIANAQSIARRMPDAHFEAAKLVARPGIVYALVADGRDHFVAVARNFHPLTKRGGLSTDAELRRPYAVKCPDTEAVRECACSSFRRPMNDVASLEGVPTLVLVLLALTDTRATYCSRLGRLLDALEVRT